MQSVINNINRKLSSLNWDFISDNSNINSDYDTFVHKIMTIINETALLRAKTSKTIPNH